MGELFSIKDVCKRFKLNPNTIRIMIKKKLFPRPAVKLGGKWRWPAHDIETFIRNMDPLHRFAHVGLAPPLARITVPDCLRDLEKIEEWFPDPCVYFLLKGNVVIYVGQTVNLGARLYQHRKEKDFDRVFFLRCNKKDLLAAEAYYILRFRPVCNGTLKPTEVGHDDPRRAEASDQSTGLENS